MATSGIIMTIGGGITLVLGVTYSPPPMDFPMPASPPAVHAPAPDPTPFEPVSLPADEPIVVKDPYAITPELIAAIIHIESSGDPLALGKAGERGLMQIMPATWREQCMRSFGQVISYELAYNPEVNRKVGTAYLEYVRNRLMMHRSEWKAPFYDMLLAGYNAGPNALRDVQFHMHKLEPQVLTYVKRGMAQLR